MDTTIDAQKPALPPFQVDGETAITGRLVCYAFRPGAKEIELDWEGEAHAPAVPAATPGMVVRINPQFTGRLVPKGFLSSDEGAVRGRARRARREGAAARRPRRAVGEAGVRGRNDRLITERRIAAHPHSPRT